MKRFLFFISIFLLDFIQPLPSYSKNEDIRILSSSADQLTFEFIPQNWQIRTKNIDGKRFVSFTFLHSTVAAKTGSPQIPARVLTLGVPFNGNATANIVDSQFETVRNVDLLPVPEISRGETGYNESFRPDDKVYQSPGFFPLQILETDEPTIFRSQRIVRLVLKPLQFLPGQNLVRKYTRVVVQVHFTGSAGTQQRPVVGKDEEWYQDLLLNYNQARTWRQAVVRRLRKPATHVFGGDNWFKITIATTNAGTKEGFFKVDGTTLSAAGIPLASLDPKTIQLFNNGGRELPQNVTTPHPDSLIENPIQVFDGGDGKFDAGDYFVFYGHSLDGVDFDPDTGQYKHHLHHYSRENAYWLTFGKKEGKRIQDKASLSTAGMTVEPHFRDLAFNEEEITNVYKSGVDWQGVTLSSTKNSQSYLFSLPGAVPEDKADFRFAVAAATSGTHQFAFFANGNPLGEFTKIGSSNRYVVGNTEFSSGGVLLDGKNTITVKYNPTADNRFAYVDWVEVEYDRKFKAVNDQLIFNSPLRDGSALYKITNFKNDNIDVFDVSDFSDIKHISGASVANGTITFADETNADAPRHYVALTSAAYQKITNVSAVEMADLRTPRTADFIIITADDFYQQALELESLRENWNEENRLETEVVKISDVFNQFGWGIVDPAAIRDFLAYAKSNWGNPRYVLLLGDGHYDYKNNLSVHNAKNLIPPYETSDRGEYTTRTTDDWFTYTSGVQNGMQMAIGRFPVQTVDEAQNVISKIVNYETKPDFGEWRKRVVIVADDELVVGGRGNETIHTEQADALAEQHVPKLLDVKKIYLMNYPAVKTASVAGVTKPQASEALMEQINRGSLIVNWIGHGNEDLWSHENVLYGPTDFAKIQNGDKTALWVAATCEFAYWDLPEKQSLAEKIINAQERGAIGMVSSARLAFATSNAAFNYSFYDRLFKNYASTGLTMRIGDAVMLAKRGGYDRTNSEKYGVFGDPCMRLGAPRNRAVIDKIQPDSIQALRKVFISGHVEKSNAVWSEFSGKVLLRVQDSRKLKIHVSASGRETKYKMAGNSVFRGIANITNGRFNVEFIVPKDISYGGNDGRVSAYFWNDKTDGDGIYEGLVVGGTAVDLVDHDGPTMKLYFNNPDFAPGDYTTPNTMLHVDVTDSLSGVNIAGDIGHKIIMTLDEDEANAKDITEFFEYNQGSYVSGTVKYPLFNLSEGLHTIQIKAWDNSNNSSIIESSFTVVTEADLEIRNVLNYPNPLKDRTRFTYELSRDAEVKLKIYSVAGRLLRSFEPVSGQIGFNVFPAEWDGEDQDGDMLANGVYLYKISAKAHTEDGEQHADKIGKLIIAR